MNSKSFFVKSYGCQMNFYDSEKITSILIQNNMENFLKIYELFVKHKDNEKFENIKSKTLIMTGENEVGSTPEMSRMLHRVIKNSELYIIPKAKHMATFERADLVNKEITKFLT